MTYPSNSGLFDRPIIFTSYDPGQALQFNGVTVAIKVGGKDDLSVDQIKQIQSQIAAQGRDIKLVLWQDYVSQTIVDTATTTGINNIILQSEGPSQLAAAREEAKTAQKAGLSVAVVTNFDGIGPGQWNDFFGPNVIAMPEAYTNTNPSATPTNMMSRAKETGATKVIITLGTYDAASEGGGVMPLQNYLQELRSMGVTSFAAFSMEAMNSEDRQILSNHLSKYPATTQTEVTQTISLPENVATGTGDAQTTQQSQTSIGKNQLAGQLGQQRAGTTEEDTPNYLTRLGTPDQQDRRAGKVPLGEGIGIEKPLSTVSTSGYKGETDPNKTYAFTDTKGRDNTLTFRDNGVVIQENQSGNPYVIWDPADHDGQHWPGFANLSIPDPNAGQTVTGNKPKYSYPTLSDADYAADNKRDNAETIGNRPVQPQTPQPEAPKPPTTTNPAALYSGNPEDNPMGEPAVPTIPPVGITGPTIIVSGNPTQIFEAPKAGASPTEILPSFDPGENIPRGRRGMY